MSVGAFFGNESHVMQYDYSICGMHLQLDTEHEIWCEPYAEGFACAPGAPDVFVKVRAAEEIETPEGTRSGSREYPVW